MKGKKIRERERKGNFNIVIMMCEKIICLFVACLFYSIYICKTKRTMKLLLSYIIGLFLILSLSACHDGGNATTLLHQADSLMQEFPDSALSLLESISHPESYPALKELIMLYF